MLTAALLLVASAAGPYDPVFHGEFESPDTCPSAPLTRLTRSDMGYTGDNINGGVRYNVDMTSFDNIWGHASPYDSLVAFPGRSNSAPVILDFGKREYIAAKFHVPENAVSLFGWIGHMTYSYGHDLSGAISTSCGDFRPAAQACFAQQQDAQPLPKWSLALNPNTFCRLQPGKDYYLNIKMTDPSVPSTTCPSTADVCAVATSNVFGG